MINVNPEGPDQGKHASHPIRTTELCQCILPNPEILKTNWYSSEQTWTDLQVDAACCERPFYCGTEQIWVNDWFMSTLWLKLPINATLLIRTSFTCIRTTIQFRDSPWLQLTLKAVNLNISSQHFKIFLLFFGENRNWHFMWIIYYGDNSHEMSIPIFSEK